MDDNDELARAMRDAVGAAEAEQSAMALCHLADTLGSFARRLVGNGFTKAESREMAMAYFYSLLEADGVDE